MATSIVMPPLVTSVWAFVYILKSNAFIAQRLLKSFKSSLVPDLKWVYVVLNQLIRFFWGGFDNVEVAFHGPKPEKWRQALMGLTKLRRSTQVDITQFRAHDLIPVLTQPNNPVGRALGMTNRSFFPCSHSGTWTTMRLACQNMSAFSRQVWQPLWRQHRELFTAQLFTSAICHESNESKLWGVRSNV